MKKFLAAVCLCGILSACLCACGESPAQSSESISAVSGAGGQVNSGAPEGGEAAGAGRTAAIGGCLLTVPQGYAIHIDGGIVLMHPEYNWQMLCVVKDRAYTEGKEDTTLITKPVEDAGYTITKPVDFVTLDGREYEYFAYDDGDNNMLLVNTQAPGGKTLVGLAARYGARTEEETLRELHVILSTAAPTTAADSTEEELVRRGVIPSEETAALEQNGIKTAAVTYELEDFTRTAAVPDEFYWIKGEDAPGEPAKTFMTADGGVNAEAYFAENFAYEDISDCVRDATEPNEDYQNVVLSDMQSETVEGRTVYYQTLSYEYYWEYKDERAAYHKLVAATSFENGCYMQVSAEGEGDGGPLRFDSIRAFFESGSPANVNTIMPGSGGLPEERRYIATQQEAEEALREDGQKTRGQTGSAELAGLEKRMEEAYGLYAVNLGAMPLPVAQQVEEAFAAMYQRYPQLRGSVTNLSVGQTPEGAVAVTAYNAFIQDEDSLYPAVYKMEIRLSEDVFCNQNKLNNMIEHSVKEGHWMEGTNVQALVAHELGHALFNRITMDKYGLSDPYYITEAKVNAFSQYVMDGLRDNQYTAAEIVRGGYEAYCAAHPEEEPDETAFQASISGYAMGRQADGGVSYSETFAEAVTDAYLHGDNMCEASAFILKAAGL